MMMDSEQKAGDVIVDVAVRIVIPLPLSTGCPSETSPELIFQVKFTTVRPLTPRKSSNCIMKGHASLSLIWPLEASYAKVIEISFSFPKSGSSSSAHGSCNARFGVV